MTPETTLVDGSKIYPEHKNIDKKTGQQEAYIVLSEEERAKSFVRPFRDRYKHIGSPSFVNPLRDLTEEEKEQYGKYNYVKFEEYPESDSLKLGRFWTQEQLDIIGKGCGTITTMNKTIAGTYARDPKFYGGTFCCDCKKHFPVNEFHWLDSSELVGS